jgi:hypothetical protein
MLLLIHLLLWRSTEAILLRGLLLNLIRRRVKLARLLRWAAELLRLLLERGVWVILVVLRRLLLKLLRWKLVVLAHLRLLL